MLAIVKEVGIFIVIAQAILYFVPGESYVKYVKVLIGVMMIAKLISPIFSLLSGEITDEIALEGELFWENMETAETDIVDFQVYETIYLEIGDEVKEKLNQNPIDGYVVEEVRIEENKEDEYQISLLVSAEEENNKSESDLIAYYEEILQTENLDLQIK